jgi:N-acetylglutamate synthase-like GNAT family acetyltransferase
MGPFETQSEFDQPEEMQGLYFASVTREAYSSFIIRHARSDEIGPIQTVLDGARGNDAEREIRLIGLYACGKLCATATAVISRNKLNRHQACKLDSIVVHHDVRHQGIAMMTVTKLFKDLIVDADLDIGTIMSHAVHPATVRMLTSLGFGAPPATGAPIVSRKIDDQNEKEFLKICTAGYLEIHNSLKHQCLQCLKGRPDASRIGGASASADGAHARSGILRFAMGTGAPRLAQSDRVGS